MNKLRLAIAGAGVIGRRHIQLMREHSECELVAIADPMPAAAAVATDLGVAAYPSLDDLLAAERPDAVIVATPNALHVPQAAALLERGVPVLVEKPLAESVAAGEQLLRSVHQTGVPLLVGHHRRHSAAIVAARECIDAGALGRIVALNATTLLHKPAPYFEMAWRRQPGGGPVLINAVHDIHSLRTLAGDIVAVQARTSHAVRRFDVEDTAAVLLEFASGALGTLIVSDTTVAPRSWEHTSGENPMYPQEGDQDCLFVAGTQGSLALPTMQLWRQRGPGSWTEPFEATRLPLQPADPLVRQLDHFCDVVERRAAPLVSAADALHTLAATLAVHDAASGGARVAVPQFR